MAVEEDVADETKSYPGGSSGRFRKPVTRLLILIRRIHLYAGLFLLPWVFLYGITGAMYNHQALFPEAKFHRVDPAVTSATPLTDLPSTLELAEQVTAAIDAATPEKKVVLADRPGAELTNDIIFEVRQSGDRYAVHLDPIAHESYVVTHYANPEQRKSLIPDLKWLKLDPNPYNTAKSAVKPILESAGIELDADPKPLGWSKLNFLVNVDDELARVTYVLRDGHVDVELFTGQDGMTARQFFMRLHTTHGQSPHWNGRSRWSIFLDAMAIAMVTWGVSGLIMWWQIKRTRLVGAAIILISVVVALFMYFDVHSFYAATKL